MSRKDCDASRGLLQPVRMPYNPDTLLLHESASMAYCRYNLWLPHLLAILLNTAGVFGAFWSMQGFFSFRVDMMPLFWFVLAAVTLTRLLYRVPKHGLLFLLCETAVIPVMLMRHPEEAAVGMGAVMRVMGQTVSHEPVQYVATVAKDLHLQYTEPQCTAFVFQIAALLLIIVTELSDGSRFCFVLRFFLTFMFLETGLYFGLETTPVAVLLLLVFWIGSLVITVTRRSFRRKMNQKPVQVSRRKKRLHTELDGRHLTTEPLLLTVLVLGAVAAAATWLLTKDYKRSAKMDARRSQLLEAYHDFTIRDVTGLLSKLQLDFGPNVISDEIDLDQDTEPDFDGHTVLKLKLDPAAQRIDYYLRGTVRTEYTGKGWAIRTGDYRSIHDLLQTLSAINRTPQTLWHSDHVAELRTDAGKYPVVHWQIDAMQKENSNYLPYQTMHPEGTRFLYDTESDLHSDYQSYQFWTVNSAVPDWYMFSANTCSSQTPAVQEYEAFVADLDCRLQANKDLESVKEEFLYYAGGMRYASLIEKLETIRSFLWQHADYNTKPPKCPGGTDFVKWFLLDSHSGYCAHYASAGVVLCRMLGIPARYVQGYVVSQDDLGPADGRPVLEINLPDHRAHAWAEIYVNGYGWIPFEFTEGISEFWSSTASTVYDPAQTTAPATTVSGSGSVTTTTTTTTMLPQQSASAAVSGSTTVSESGSGSGSGSGSRGEGTAMKLFRYFLEFVLPVLVIAGVICLWILYHRRTVESRERKMHHKNPNLACSEAYAFLLYLLRIQHIRQGNRLHGAFAELAEEQCELLEQGSLIEAVRIQEQAVFSRDGITAEDADVMRGTAEGLAGKLYDSSGRFRRFLLRWVRHIVA